MQTYDDVRGMVKNVFFVTHNHKENGGVDDTASKYNMYEVGIHIVDCEFNTHVRDARSR